MKLLWMLVACALYGRVDGADLDITGPIARVRFLDRADGEYTVLEGSEGWLNVSSAIAAPDFVTTAGTLSFNDLVAAFEAQQAVIANLTAELHSVKQYVGLTPPSAPPPPDPPSPPRPSSCTPTLPGSSSYVGFQGTTPVNASEGLVLNGNDQYLVLDMTNADVTGDLTVAFRATQLSVPSGYERVFEFDNGCAPPSVFADVWPTLGGTWQVHQPNGGWVGNDQRGGGLWEVGVTHTYAFVSNGNIYRDGAVLFTSTALSGIPSVPRSNFRLGGVGCGPYGWHASVNWFGVWNTVLTTAQIAALHVSGQASYSPAWFQSFTC